MMNTLWVLVCDASRGRLFEVPEPAAPWKLLEVFTHDESRARDEDLVSDRQGTRSPEGGSSHHNAMAPTSDPKKVEKAHFSHQLGKMLDQAMRSNKFRAWVLVAPPQFLGMLRAELTPELQKHLVSTVDKDLTHMSEAELTEKLRDAALLPVDQRTVLGQSTNHPH
jgi:protein required for attachment to host cells